MSLDTENKIIEKVRADFKEAEFSIKKGRRIEVILPSNMLFGFASKMKFKHGFTHLSTINCVDWIEDEQFELVYHFWNYSEKMMMSAKIRIDREQSSFETVSTLWQAAIFFERDIHEMFGVTFEGNKNMEKYILTEWSGPPPMKKDFITREYALNFFKFKDDYNPEWLRKLKEQGEAK